MSSTNSTIPHDAPPPSIEQLSDDTSSISTISSLSKEDPTDIVTITDMNKYINNKMEYLWHLCNEYKEKNKSLIIDNTTHLTITSLVKKQGKCKHCDISFDVICLEGFISNEKYHETQYTGTIESWNLLCKCDYSLCKTVNDTPRQIETYPTKFNKKYQVISPLLNCNIPDHKDYFAIYLDDGVITLY